MLPSWSKPLCIALSPDRLILSGTAGSQPERSIVACAPAEGAPPWGSALASLAEALKSLGGRKARASVILSNRLVRYLLVPSSAELTTEDERLAWVQHHFQKVFGAATGPQQFRWQTQGAGRPLVASAVDQALLEALEATVNASGAQLISVEPYLQRSFNRFRRQFTLSSQWWALLEPKLMVLALLQDGRFTSLRAHGVDQDWAERLPLWLERERAVCEHGEAGRDVFICAPEAAHSAWPLRNGWNFRRLAGADSADSAEAAYAMVATER